MKITDKDGKEVHITMEEAERIAGEVHKIRMGNGGETNASFLNRALDNIAVITGSRPRTEDELKEMLYKHTSNTKMSDIEMLYEAMEAIVGWYGEKVR